MTFDIELSSAATWSCRFSIELDNWYFSSYVSVKLSFLLIENTRINVPFFEELAINVPFSLNFIICT